MKELVQNFKKLVNEYNFDDQEKKLDTSMKLVDIILEMLTITEPVDASNVKILASFTKILSSDFCHNILDGDMVGSIYTSKVIPILDYFEDKYKQEDSLELFDTEEEYKSEFSFFPDINEKYSKKNLEKVKEDNKEVVVFKIIDRSNFTNDDSYDPEESEKIFNMLKATNSVLYFIVKNPNNSDILKDNIADIMNSTKVFMNHPYGNNKFISTLIYELCDSIINILNIEGYISDLHRRQILETITQIDSIKWEMCMENKYDT